MAPTPSLFFSSHRQNTFTFTRLQAHHLPSLPESQKHTKKHHKNSIPATRKLTRSRIIENKNSHCQTPLTQNSRHRTRTNPATAPSWSKPVKSPNPNKPHRTLCHRHTQRLEIALVDRAGFEPAAFRYIWATGQRPLRTGRSSANILYRTLHTRLNYLPQAGQSPSASTA